MLAIHSFADVIRLGFSPPRGHKIWTIVVIFVVIGLGLILYWKGVGFSSSPIVETNLPQQVATVNGVVITQDMVDRELKVSRLNVVEPLPALLGEDLKRAREEALNQLVVRQIILQAAAGQGFSLDNEFIAKRVDLLFGSSGAETLDKVLAQSNLTQRDLNWWVGEIFTVEEFATQVIMADVAPEDRQQVYNEWLNIQQTEAKVTILAAGQTQTFQVLGVGEQAPNFTLTNLDGRPISLSNYRGKVVLINFWTTWCPSCITEMPEYERVYQQYNSEFVVLGINLQESAEHVKSYTLGLGVTFPVLLDRDGKVTTRQYQVTGMPGSFIINREGKIYYRHVGPMNVETLTAKLMALGL